MEDAGGWGLSCRGHSVGIVVIVWSTPMELIVEDGQLLLKVAAIDGDGTGTVMDNCC